MRALAVLAIAALCAAETVAQAPSPVEFDVASIKPNPIRPTRGSFGGGYCRGLDTAPGTYPRLAAPTGLGQCLFTSVDVTYLIRAAYAAELRFTPLADMIKGVPPWAGREFFDVSAKAENPATSTVATLHRMMQTLLADRFKLKVHFEARDVQGYGLHVSKSGSRLQESRGDDPPRIFGTTPPSPDVILVVGENATTGGLANTLANFGIGPVVNKTNLQGRYDFRLTFDRGSIVTVKGSVVIPSAAAPSSGPSLSTALEQLGLILIRESVRVQSVVIDSVERPTEN